MGNKPESILRDDSARAGATRTYLPRQFRDDITAPVPVLVEGDPRHGSMNGYTNFKCKCARCKAAGKAYWSARRAKGKADAA